MLDSVAFALISVLITIGIGYYAGWKKAFSDHDNQILVKLIMNYALPLSIFAGIWSTPRKIIVANISLGIWLFIGMIGIFVILIGFYKEIRHLSNDTAALKALSIAEPSIPFIGAALLPFLVNAHISAITIGIAALITNLIMLPVSLTMLSTRKDQTFRSKILNTIRQPLVIAAFGGFVLALIGWPMPKIFTNIFMNLGKTAGGLAMFSIGILLATHKVMTNFSVSCDVVAKNILVPCLIWALMILFKVPAAIRSTVVLALAIPTASLPSILSVRFRIDESNIASIKFWSTLLSFISIFIFALVLK